MRARAHVGETPKFDGRAEDTAIGDTVRWYHSRRHRGKEETPWWVGRRHQGLETRETPSVRGDTETERVKVEGGGDGGG